MNEESLATVAEEMSDITVESNSDSVFDAMGNTWSTDNPLPVQIVDPTSESEDITEEEITIRYYDQATEADPIVLEDVNVYKSANTRASTPEFKNLWKLKISGETYEVLFPQNAQLEVVDGKLYNTGNSNITGLVIDSSFSDSSYSNYTFTIVPLTGSSSQNTVYRYGSRSYLTRYRVGTGTSLTTDVTYVQPTVESRPAGWSLSPANMVIAGLLLLSIIISVIGGIFRR